MKNVSSNTKNYCADVNTKVCKEAHSYFIYIILFVDKFQHTLMGALCMHMCKGGIKA